MTDLPRVDPPATANSASSHRSDSRQLATHLALFLLTCVTTTLAVSWRFSASLMAILLTHEMGHYVFARRHGIRVSLPYFIPLPMVGIGTLGAVISIKERIRSRDALVDVGASGPIAGLLVAIPVIIYGLATSEVRESTGVGLIEGNSLLYMGLKLAVLGELLPAGGRDVILNDIAFAGWVGFLVTMINLIPIGQLDGGHIAYAYFGAGHNRAAGWLHRALLPLGLGVFTFVTLQARWAAAEAPWSYGLQAALPWGVWWLMLSWMRRMSRGRWHPPTDDSQLSPGRLLLCRVMLVVFLGIFVPIPFRLPLP